VVRGRRLTA